VTARKPAIQHEAAALATDLGRVLHGDVRFDPASLALYSTDSSNYRQIPIGVVIPRDVDDVIATVDVCRKHGAPILSRGAGTSLAGQGCNAAVVIDFSRYVDRILEIDPERRRARFEPGVILDDLRAAAEKHGLTFGPDPATHNRCTLGGMIGNDSCGMHSIMSGRTAHNIEALDVLTYDGLRLTVGRTSEDELRAIAEAGGRRAEIYAALKTLRDDVGPLIRERYPKIPRRVSGYNLEALLPENGFDVAKALVGSEGTCVVVLSATGRLVASPPVRVLLILGYGDVYAAAEAVPELLSFGPLGLEGVDDQLVGQNRLKGLNTEAIARLPEGRGWLFLEFGGDTLQDATGRVETLLAAVDKRAQPPARALFTEAGAQRQLWPVRESALGATAIVPGLATAWEGWEDSAVPPDKVAPYLRELRGLLDRYRYRGAFYGHFGDGCIHTRIDFDFSTHDGVRRYRAFVEEAADLVLRYGGSLSGEHGDGQSRAELLGKMYGPELVAAFERFKAIWDPENRLNPGKLVRPYRLDENLRHGPEHPTRVVKTHFHFPADRGSFAQAIDRCVGVGACRRLDGGTMCPSFMATREEAHSTRGRARLLFELLQGEVLTKGWRDAQVREALDLCLACKSCKRECPTQVDMATCKAEFLAQHYEGRLRPLSAYAFGLVDVWLRLGSLLPRLGNALVRAPLVNPALKALMGIASERKIPRLAPQTFEAWFARQSPGNEGEDVILWPDTFCNHLHPQALKSATAVLRAAGFRPRLPHERGLCCGRALYDQGMLTRARRQLERVLDALAADLDAGVRVVVLEPSCLAVFRDELLGLLPDDPRAARLARQALTLSELLMRRTSLALPPPPRQIVLQGHCHQKALWGLSADEALLKRVGARYELLDAGCCGMAGAFGFKRAHYAVSVAIAERGLLPKVRSTSPDALLVADGFSCREQIAQLTERRALHLAEALASGLETSPGDVE
jgi:FAD/FMN-containing dehydrogenase/Fe-S oxidoreductase